MILSLWIKVNENRHVRKVTANKITGFYTVLSLSYCIIQVLFLVAAWQVNHSAGSTLEAIVTNSGNGTSQFSFVDRDAQGGRVLRLCQKGLSRSRNDEECPIMYPVPKADPIAINSNARSPSAPAQAIAGLGKRAGGIEQNLSNGVVTHLVVQPFSSLKFLGRPTTTPVIIEPVCFEALKWPYHRLLMVRREDIIAVAYQAWLLGMSLVAIFTESIPHIGASFIVHIIALAWSAVQLSQTTTFHTEYQALISDVATGACAGLDVISDYFSIRLAYQIATTVINFVSLIASGYLTWRLFESYGWATFKKMGASISISRAYKAALALSIGVQLSIFFYMSSVGLWIDAIRKGLMGATPEYLQLYMAFYITTTLMTMPWLYLAWYGIRRESKRLMYSFYVTSMIYLGCSGGMFKSDTFIQIFRRWSFIAGLFVLSYFLIAVTIALSIICQVNFGKGLPHYFERRNGEESDDYNDDFHPSPDEKSDDLEKVAFPGTFGGSTASLPYIKRMDSAGSSMSVMTQGSIRMTPKEIESQYAPNIQIPTFPLRAQTQNVGRNLTASTGASSNSPSWSPGDDKHLMNQEQLVRADSASSFGHLDSGLFDRKMNPSFRTASTEVSTMGVDPFSVRGYPAAPKRTLTSSSGGSNFSKNSSSSGLSRQKTIDLSEEM